MAGKVAKPDCRLEDIKAYNPLKLHSGLLASLREAPFGRLTGN